MTPVKLIIPLSPTTCEEGVTAVYMFSPGWTRDPKRLLILVLPEKMVVAEMEVPLIVSAVIPVNTGDPMTLTMGLLAVPPVLIFVPG